MLLKNNMFSGNLKLRLIECRIIPKWTYFSGLLQGFLSDIFIRIDTFQNRQKKQWRVNYLPLERTLNNTINKVCWTPVLSFHIQDGTARKWEVFVLLRFRFQFLNQNYTNDAQILDRFFLLNQAAHVRVTDKFVCLCHLVFTEPLQGAFLFWFSCLSCKLCLSVLVLCISIQVLDALLYCLLLMLLVLWTSLFFFFTKYARVLCWCISAFVYSYVLAPLCLCHMCLHAQVCGFY